MESRGVVAAGTGRGRAGVWRPRHRDRSARARGARGVAAGLPAVAAAGLSRAGPRWGGRRRALRRDPCDLARLPLQGRAAGPRRGRQPLLTGAGDLARALAGAERPVRRARALGAAPGGVDAAAGGLCSEAMAFPETRLRRLRASAALRGLVHEPGLRPGQLVLPLFVREESGSSAPEPIATMPGVARLEVADAVAEAR